VGLDDGSGKGENSMKKERRKLLPSLSLFDRGSRRKIMEHLKGVD
jgi:hypothetical protein